MPKRGASEQITKDDYDAGGLDGSSEGGDGTWKEASKDKLKERTFVKVKRKEKSTPAAGLPKFSFGAPAADTKAEKPKPAPVAFNAFAKLVNKTNWECPVCFVSNKKELKKCAACEEINPNLSEEEKAKLKSSTDGAAATAAKFGAGSSGTKFSFGSAAAGGTSFSFGSDSASTSGFTFGSTTGDNTLSFGAVAGTSSGWADKDKDAKTGFAFETSTSASLMSQKEGTKTEFKDKKPEATGEEKDVLLLKVPTKVYTLKEVEVPQKEGESEKKKMVTKFVESGVGDLHINSYEKDGKKKARMVLRVDKTQRLVLNAPIFKEMTKELQSDKFIRFTSMDLEGAMAVYLLKFKSKTDASSVFTQLDNCLSEVQ